MMVFLVVVVLAAALAGLHATGHPIASDWALVALVAIPAVVILVAIAAIFNRKLKLKGSASKRGGSGDVHFD